MSLIKNTIKATGINGDALQITAENDIYLNGDNIYFRKADETQHMRLTSTGNLGIGTSSIHANRRLHVVGAAGKNARFERTASGGSHIEFSDSTTTVEPSLGSDGNNLTFATNFQEKARIDASGHLLVGTTDATTPSTNAKKVVKGIETINPAKREDFFAISDTITTINTVIRVLVNK